ncbi:high choriolytic enzyme 1 isoform X1 [Dicentrarchus labrax]|uniref:high choriolytic enzyme 1 isoform X1 n=2 Tax=Dicentrarchus labrax TaxID=13489 RepID=UPI0021F54A1F|nr:high choriolytic enzyme 1 isoform X1 [Dicentrarchus labrax]
MTPVFLFLLFLSVRAAPPGLTNEEAQIDESSDISEIIERANEGISMRLEHGDIVPNNDRNAVPCTATGCKWPKTGRYVYVPISISTSYSTEERNIIIRSLLSFHQSTCIRFVWRKNTHRDYINFFSGSGCYSSLGRRVGGQQISLKRTGCLYKKTVQHEALHALGFHHEHVRSDRDSYVSILTENILPEKEKVNFRKVQTNNLRTPYDFNSVMHYGKYAFTKNNKPTIVAKGNPNLSFGHATQMSANDIARVNRLYQCCE